MPTLSRKNLSFICLGFVAVAVIAAALIVGATFARGTAAEPTNAVPAKWLSRWDAKVGLWSQDHPGHTAPVRDLDRIHPAPSAAARLLLAAQAGQLAEVDVSAVLSAIRKMQTLNVGGKDHGELRWYFEEKHSDDHNGSFFTGMSLIALHVGHGDQLTAPQRAALLEIFTDLRVWFAVQAEKRDFYYPNRCLGDLVGAWLLGEVTGVRDDGQLRQTMLDAADYWATNGWGWGEHLSDIYAGICLDELSALLLFSAELPDDVRRQYTSLFRDLLALDDAFGDLPRVPAIRMYAFEESPTRIRYRDTVRPLPEGGTALPAPATPVMPPEVGNVFRHRPPLGATLHARGWHNIAPAALPAGADLSVPCYDGAVATARIEDDIRIGSLSRFPFMPKTDQAKWGMSWQTAPVALLRRQGDWAFLQWETQEADRIRAHPANDIRIGYGDNALTADDEAAASAVGQTFSLQRGGQLIVVRLMPNLPASWDRLTDRIRIIDANATPVMSADDGRHQLTLSYPERTVTVACVPISAGARVEQHERSTPSGSRIFDWGLRFDQRALKTLDAVVVVWGISTKGSIDSGPLILPVQGADPARVFELHWEWPESSWHLRIDVDSDTPIEEILASPAPTVKP